jgi:hypothetical protein
VNTAKKAVADTESFNQGSQDSYMYNDSLLAIWHISADSKWMRKQSVASMYFVSTYVFLF